MIRTYFAEYAVVADREVQIFRRKLSKAAKGAPGSLVDVLCTAPARGTVIDEPVRIPIEVKLSHNPESATGLNAQLVDRYVSELGTDAGLFVVAWMGTAVPKNYRPRWKTRAEAIDELGSQAAEASSTGLDIRSYVIDLSLPLAAETAKKGAGRRKVSKKSSTKKVKKKATTAVKKAATNAKKKKREQGKAKSIPPTKAKAANKTGGQRRPSKARRS